MQNNFVDSLDLVLKHEGGYSDHPDDPGGATMKGVTLTVFREHCGEEQTKQDLKEISDEQLQKIYGKGYWHKCRADDLPSGVDYAVFDAAVNSGPGRSAKWLQGAIGAAQDGGIGPNTLGKVKAHDPQDIINDMCDRRLSFLQGLSNWDTFGRGWGRRVEDVRAKALSMTD
jgi:lysozyme family protein